MNKHASSPQRALGYVRISDDRAGDEAGVGRQEEDVCALAARLGWQLDEVVVENDTSAFKRRAVTLPDGRQQLRVVRPGFRRILDLITNGDADGLIAYDLDRAARDPRDLEDLVDAVEQRTPRLPVSSVTGSLRLDNDADVTMARVMVAVANKSSRDTQRRVRRKLEELAAAGASKGGGVRPFGYEKDGTTLRPSEAAVVEQIVERFLEGETLYSIRQALDDGPIPPVKGGRWRDKAVTDLLRGGRIYGLRVHHGEIVGPAMWPSIIPAERRDEILARLELNGHGHTRQALRYWCNDMLWCGRCGHRVVGQFMQPGPRGPRWRYWCSTLTHPRGCAGVGISGAGVEGEVERQILAYLARPDVVEALSGSAQRADVTAVRRRLAEDQAQLRELARLQGERRIGMGEWLVARAPIDERIRGAEVLLKRVVPLRVRRLLEAESIPSGWASMPPAGKQELALVVLEAAGFLGWRVMPAAQDGPRRFDPGRLELMPLEPAAAEVS